ncbi:MAG: cardiolipin synthase [Proteobacteria bacterium]|nr:MAG: cardiolipin synthase [Pseudomonadota bacterium]
MNWIALLQATYFVVLLLVIIQIIYDTRNTTKALSYILAVIFLPVLGIIFYLSFGVNFRKRKFYSHKLLRDEKLRQDVKAHGFEVSESIWENGLFPSKYRHLSGFILNTNISPVTAGNEVTVYQNGEQKFPALLQAIKQAQHHIHVEYYIYESDRIGNQVADALIERAQQGVEVRFIYDDFGSFTIGRQLLKKMHASGIKTTPFYRLRLHAITHRINYRNHRKIVVIDGNCAFTGGINVGDNYINQTSSSKKPQPLYWRDIHIQIKGPAVAFLQYVFISDWNFCGNEEVSLSPQYFPQDIKTDTIEPELVQLVSSGPDSDLPNILFSIMNAILSARSQILITTPYFIPGDRLKDVLIIAAKSGVKVQLLVPYQSDSWIVNTAAKSYYSELLSIGVDIFMYKKGFIHSKTMVIDNDLVILGSANMDVRSFDINFEINTLIYGEAVAQQLNEVFEQDLKDAEKLDPEQWLQRPTLVHFWERVVRLFSPMM